MRDKQLQRIRFKVASAEHRPCLCGCGTMVSILSNDGQLRQGWVHNHDKRGRAKLGAQAA